MWRCLLAGLAGMALVAAVPVTGAAAQEPEPGTAGSDDLARFRQATTVAGLAVVVERGRRLVAERETTYVIAIGNHSDTARTVVVRAMVPPWLDAASHDDGLPGDGFVDWRVSIGAGTFVERRLTGAYAAPPDAPARVTFTACALDPTEQRPIVCATDAGELRPALSAGWWAVGGVGMAGFAAAALLMLHQRGVVNLRRWPPVRAGGWLGRPR